MKTAPRCQICKRELKSEESIAQGIGPECADKFASMAGGCTAEALGIDPAIAGDAQVAKWLRVAGIAAAKGHRRDMEQFQQAALRAAARVQGVEIC